ncbi:MAG: carbon starvation CstA family protein [Candidatus Margulisiibacteriota bacterium]
MNILLVLVISLPIFLLAYYVYANYISASIGLDRSKKTPAFTYQDNSDFVPTHKWVLMGHHFASIAGAGPIVGPAIALYYGFVPVWLWILIGAVFFGAVHDFTSLFVSIREGGRSMAEVAGNTLGKSGFILFISFTIVMIVLVTSAFLGLTAKALTSTAAIDGVENIRIGGIASTSVVIMTLTAPILGYFLYKRRSNTAAMTLAASVIAIAAVIAGLLFPITIDPKVWMVILTVYSFIAAGIPVWLVLQPRDFTNVHILYAGIALLTLGIIAAGLKGMAISAPAFNIAQAQAHSSLGSIFPVLFITVACGAISGFHALVSGGTSSKQIRSEGDARMVGFGSMLLEGVLALGVLIAVGAGLKFVDYQAIVFPAQAAGSNPILAFALGCGGILNYGLGIPAYFGSILGILMVEGFVITSLDTAVRLNRYLFEELWSTLFKHPPKLLKSYLFNSGLSVVIMFYLGYTNAYITIWPIFGTANQLLAALTLIAVSAWLMMRGKKMWFAVIPAILMLTTTLISLLLLLFNKYLPQGNIALISADILLLLLSFGLTAKAVDLFFKKKKQGHEKFLRHGGEEEKIANEMHLG